MKFVTYQMLCLKIKIKPCGVVRASLLLMHEHCWCFVTGLNLALLSLWSLQARYLLCRIAIYSRIECLDKSDILISVPKGCFGGSPTPWWYVLAVGSTARKISAVLSFGVVVPCFLFSILRKG